MGRYSFACSDLRQRSFLAVVLCLLANCQSRGGSRRSDAPKESPSVARDTVRAPAAAPRPPGSAALTEETGARGTSAGSGLRFAIIGDFGTSGESEREVAELVLGERPDFIITLGDNNYPFGEASTIDQNIGRLYASYIHPYTGRFGKGASENRFFPSLGNHDWYTRGARPYLAYFTLPGNERYYDFQRGDVHLFAVDSDENEPDGITAGSVQARWLERRLKESKAAWQVVYMHHPPFSSGRHGSTPALQWAYADWGADVVLAGHDHHYERLEIGGVHYLVNGLGGRQAYSLRSAIPGSRFRYNSGHGAQFAEATATRLAIRFVNTGREVVDELVVTRP